MNFLALIIALVLQPFGGAQAPWHRDEWFELWWHWLQARGASAALTVGIAVAVPVLAALWLQLVSDSWLFGLVGLALAVLLLVYALGRGDFAGLWTDLRAHCAVGDGEAAWLTAVAALPELDGQLVADVPAEGAGQAAAQALRQALLYEACQRWYAPIFFFVVAGPAGALAYRLLQFAAARSAPARRALFVADWVPARLLAFTFALTGDFAAASRILVDAEEAAPALLAATARRALASAAAPEAVAVGALGTELTALEGLLARSAGAWLVALSLGYLFL